jgi:hypothetical protein
MTANEEAWAARVADEICRKEDAEIVAKLKEEIVKGEDNATGNVGNIQSSVED